MIRKAVSFIKKFLNKKDRRKELVADFHTTIIRVDDNYISPSSVVLDERLIGNIYSLKEVTVAPTAEISGNITSRFCNIDGKVFGDIISTEYAHLHSSAIIYGNIKAKAITVEAGCVINGAIRIEGNIDERDLIEKVENRLPQKLVNKTEEAPYLIANSQDVEKTPDVKKPEKQVETSKDIVKKESPIELKKEEPKTIEIKESSKTTTDSWY